MKFIHIVIVFSFFISTECYAVTWSGVISQVKMVGTGWENNTACVMLASGDVAKIDISTDMGKAKLSIALSAKMGGKDLRIVFDQEGVLSGGCETGTTIRPSSLFTIQE